MLGFPALVSLLDYELSINNKQSLTHEHFNWYFSHLFDYCRIGRFKFSAEYVIHFLFTLELDFLRKTPLRGGDRFDFYLAIDKFCFE